MKTKNWIILIGAFFLLCLGLTLWLRGSRTGGTVANIYQDGRCIRSIDLAAVTAAYTFTVSDELGENVVEVRPGQIRVLEADCPDQVCVQMGWLKSHVNPIVCLPHRLVIRLDQTAAAADAVDVVSQ